MGDTLSLEIKSKFYDVAVKYNLDLLVIFGSYAKGKANVKSDYDLAFWRVKSLSKKEQRSFYDDIVQICQDKSFDLVDISLPIAPKLMFNIFYEGVCIYQSNKYIFQSKKEASYFDVIDAQELLYKTRDKFLADI